MKGLRGKPVKVLFSKGPWSIEKRATGSAREEVCLPDQQQRGDFEDIHPTFARGIWRKGMIMMLIILKLG